MPQIDASTFLSQAFWLIVCFCTLWGLLSVCITPKLTDIIEQRKRKINDFIQKAEQLRLQAEQSLTAYNKAVSAAKETVEKEIAENQQETEAYLKKTENKLSAEFNKKILTHEITLEKEKEIVSKQISVISQDLAFDIVNKLGFSKISRRDIAKIAAKENIDG